jgi:hypothetical protein
VGQIRLLVLVGPDLPQESEHYLDTLFQHLEWQWFRVAIAGETAHAAPSAPLQDRIPLRPGAGWLSGGRELRRLRALVGEYDLFDCHGYQALTYAARAGCDPALTVYTRHYIPERRSARQREAWLMSRVARILVPHPHLAGTAGSRARLVPLTESGGRALPRLDPGQARARLGINPARPVAAMLADQSADLDLADALVRRHPEVTWLYLRGAIGGGTPTLDPGLALAAADVVLFPARHALEDGGLLDGALSWGRAVLAARVPGVVGRLRCLTEGYLLPAGDVESWDEVFSALLSDRDLRDGVAEGARRAYGPGGPGQEVRVLESYYAGVLMAATGSCPVCSPEAMNLTQP